MSLFTLESSFCWNVVIALAHSIWIGCAIGAFTWIANHVLKGRSPNARYWLDLSALFMFAILLPVAFCVQAQSPSAVSAFKIQSDFSGMVLAESTMQNEVATETGNPATADLSQSIQPGLAEQPVSADIVTNIASSNSWFVLPNWLVRTIAAGYLLGVCLMCFRLSFAIFNSQRILSRTEPISDAAYLEKFESVLDSFSLHFKPAIAKSANIAVPMVAGFLRPVVLLPTSFVTGLTTAEIESVLRHELAHLHRYDHVLIVLQRMVESILFFHPVTWYLSRQIHEEREHCCDELAVATGISRIEYANALLKVAEFAIIGSGSNSSQSKSVAMAADGHRPSKLRSRIARLLLAERTKPATGHKVLLCLTAMLMLSAAWAAGQVLAQEDSKPESDLDDKSAIVAELTEVLERGRRTVDAVETAHIQFKLFRKGGLNGTKNPDQCKAIIEKLRPIDTRAKMKTLIETLTEISMSRKLSNNDELHFDQNRTREAIDWNGKTDIHITDQDLSLRWGAANYQLNILPVEESHTYQITKNDFLKSHLPDVNSPFYVAAKVELDASEISRCDEGFFIRNKPDDEKKPDMRREIKISKTTGLPVYRYWGRQGSPEVQYWLDWKSYRNGIHFPGTLVELKFTRDNTLGSISVLFIESAKFNIKLPDHLFVMSAPAGTNVIRGKEHLGIMQEDVFDVTSEFELKAASKWQPKRELTPEEKRGALVAKKLYALKDGEVLKRIGPPFPLAQKYVPHMLGLKPDLRRAPNEISRILNSDKDNKLSYYSFFEGGVFKVRGLAMRFFQLHPSAIEGDTELLEMRIPGDFVIRAGATRKDMEAAFEQMLEAECQKDLAVQTNKVDRPLYVVSGTLELNPVNGQKEVDVNAGAKSEAYPKLVKRGNAEEFLRSLSGYINCAVKIEGVKNGEDEFWWSERVYNLNSHPPEERYDFRIENVLKIVSSQTGLKFEKQSSPKSILTIRKTRD